MQQQLENSFNAVNLFLKQNIIVWREKIWKILQTIANMDVVL